MRQMVVFIVTALAQHGFADQLWLRILGANGDVADIPERQMERSKTFLDFGYGATFANFPGDILDRTDVDFDAGGPRIAVGIDGRLGDGLIIKVRFKPELRRDDVERRVEPPTSVSTVHGSVLLGERRLLA